MQFANSYFHLIPFTYLQHFFNKSCNKHQLLAGGRLSALPYLLSSFFRPVGPYIYVYTYIYIYLLKVPNGSGDR